jgi:hypothetical protein
MHEPTTQRMWRGDRRDRDRDRTVEKINKTTAWANQAKDKSPDGMQNSMMHQMLNFMAFSAIWLHTAKIQDVAATDSSFEN